MADRYVIERELDSHDGSELLVVGGIAESRTLSVTLQRFEDLLRKRSGGAR